MIKGKYIYFIFCFLFFLNNIKAQTCSVTAASSSPTLCINTALTTITHSSTVAIGIASTTTNYGLPAGVTASFASNTITITGTPIGSGTFNYSIPLTGGCGAVNAIGTITVNPNNSVGLASSTPTLCINTLLPNITHTTTGATGIASTTTNYGLPAGVTASFASNTITITGTPTGSGTFNYSIPLTGGCGAVNAIGTITVNPNNSVGLASSTPTLCINTLLPNITHTTTGATGIASTTTNYGLPAGVTASFASNTITITGTPTGSGTFNYSIPLTGGCGAVNAIGTITVNPNNTVGLASSTPTLCINTLLTNITHTTTGATGIASTTTNYGLPAGVSVIFASNTITISGTPTGSGTFNYSIPLTGGCGAVLNAIGTITVLGVSIGSGGSLNSSTLQLVTCISPPATSGEIGFFLALPLNVNLIQSIVINWGDGSNSTNVENYTSLQLHNYYQGSYTVTITTTFTNGCTHVITYSAFIGSSPSPATLALYVNQSNGCVPHSTNYTFNIPPLNVNGTTYTVTWGDGTLPVVYTHPNVPATLSHIYNTSSCGNNVILSGITYYNVFQPSVITQNPCSTPQPSAAGLISVSKGPIASFTPSKTTICPTGSIQFNSTSNFGLTIPTTTGAACITSAPYYWTITNVTGTTTGYSLISGTLGSNNGSTNQSFWTNGSINPNIQFNISGIYTITLHVKNFCGLDTETQTICVITPPVSSFNPITNTNLCSPASIALSSNSTLPMCGSTPISVAYQWSVTNPAGCPTCSSSLEYPTNANTSLSLVNNSTSVQTFTVLLTLTPLDPLTNLPLSSPNCAHTSIPMNLQVYPNVSPTFAAVGPYCTGATIPALPTSSTNTPAITGSWSPAINNTATTTYTFTPTAGQCATSTTKIITIIPNVTPTFTAVGPYCTGATIPALPTSSTNTPAITGSWSPAINNTATTTYTFTPTAGQCALSQTLTITVNPNSITPTFAAVGPYCTGATIPALPTSSTNTPAITGSWSPAINNTATTTYTFTPTAGQCALSQTLTITVNPNSITPTFAAVGPYCTGATIPALPTSSTNTPAITGSWSPAINNTATTTYTFTPTAGQCALSQTLTITVNPNSITPTFAAVGPYCTGETIPALPTSSTNTPAITGSWSPAINNTATTTYTFTPTAGQCALSQTLTITVNPNSITPTFAAVGPYCTGATIPALQTSSTNTPAITGSWSPAINNTATTTYTFTPTAGQCATSTTKIITIIPNVTPTFTAVGPYCTGATIPALPTSSTNTPAITGSWSPAINNTATTTYTFTPTAGQCALSQTLTITVNPNSITPTFAAVGPYCTGATIPALPTSSTNTPAITGSWSPAINNTATTTYTFTPNAGQCATSTTKIITIIPNVTPTLTAVGPYCTGATIPALPTSSTNTPAITGSWSPAINNTATTTYTFTPTAGQCALSQTLTITVNPNSITPTFAAVGPYCTGATIPALPTSSTNTLAITGSWSPAINNTATTTYTFTPTAGQCALSQTLTITVNPNSITPTFAAVGPYCTGATIPALPTSSTNTPAITGSWSPAINNTATTTYTFTPNAGQCALSQTLTITVNPNSITPTFAAVGPYCTGATIPALPTSSTNTPAITGSWSPAINNTATTTYTFTPNAGQCALSQTLTITVNPNSITPTFAAVGPYCTGATIPALPTSSTNTPAITGSWSPAINNTATTTYTFTPTAGQCALSQTLTITVNPNSITPTFAAVGPYCTGATIPALPTSSTNTPAITGSWSPAINNTATTTYTFTPTAGQCATSTTKIITIIPNVTPTFTAVGPYCTGATIPALPTSSTNTPAITGSWSPAINNTATTTYTFTPTAGQCALSQTLTITVNPNSITPTFAAVGPYCTGATIPALPTSSTNTPAITGSWSPAINNTATTTYTFTPNAGQCATSTTKIITIIPNVTPTFTAVEPYCTGATIPALPTSSTNTPAITGTWSPAITNTATTTYTFTPTAGQCALSQTLTITVNPNSITPTFAAVGPYCTGATIPALPTSSTNTPAITGTWSPAITNTATTTYTFTPTAGQCALSQTLTITVNPNSITPTFAAVGPYCTGATIPALPTSSTNTPAITGSWSPAINNTATTTYTFTPTAGQCALSQTLTITVNPNSITPTFAAVGPYCTGATIPALPTSSTNTPAITGSWSPAINNTATTTYTFTPTAGQCALSQTLTITVNPNSITPTFAAVGPYCTGATIPALPTSSTNTPAITGSWSPAINNTATTTYTFTPTAGQCALSQTLTITVNPLPIVNVINDTLICNNESLATILGSNIPSNFNWIATSNNNVNGESIMNQTSNFINDLLTNSTTIPQYLIYTITPTSFPYGCVGPDSSITVQVQPNIVLNIPQNIEICSGSPVNGIINTNVPSNYQWFVSVDNPNVSGESLISNTSNVISDILINNTTINQLVVYSVFPTSIEGNCPGQAQTITVLVKPPLSLLNTDTLTICSNNSVNLNLVANTTFTLNWYADQSLNVFNETTSVTTSSIINDLLINPTNTVQEVTYNVTGTSTLDGCSTPIIPITVFVNPFPTVNPSADLNLCHDFAATPVLLIGNVTGSVYNWIATNLNVGLTTLTGADLIPSFLTTNTGLSPISTIVEVTPIFINNNIQCEGPIDQFTITVNPVPSVFPVSNTILCEGELSSSVILLGTLGGTIFNWENSNVSVGLASPGAGNIPVFTAQNPTLLPIQSTITVTPLYGLEQCPGDSISFDITVKPAPTLNPQTVSICSGETLDLNLSADLPCTFQWFATPNLNVLNETYTPTQNTDIINDLLVQTTTIPQTVQYNVSAISTQYNCVSNPSSIFNVIVNPLPAPSFTILNPPFCDLSPISFQNNTSGLLDFTWSFGDGVYSNLNSPAHQFPTFGAYDVQLNAINPQTGCKDSIVNQIIISDTPSAAFSYSDSLGCGVLDVTYTADSSNPTWGYLWDFGNGVTTQQASSIGYQFDIEGCYDVSLTVTNNNGCAATALYTDIACVYVNPIASFSTDQYVLNEIDPLVSFYNNSINATSFEWEFGDGTNSFAENPIHTYPDDAASYLVKLVAYNQISCTDSATITIVILKDVGLYVPNSFTPDGDEYNHTFHPIFTEGFKKDSFHMSIFDRWGELVFETYDPSFGWNGTYGKYGIQCQIGTYTWVIELIESQTAENRKFTGHVNLIR